MGTETDLWNLLALVREVADDATTTYQTHRMKRNALEYQRYKARLEAMRRERTNPAQP